MNEKQKQAYMICVFVGALAVVGALYYQYSFASGQIRAAKSKQASEQKKLDVVKKDYTEIKEWVGKEDEAIAQMDQLKKLSVRLPDQPDAPGFLNAMLQVLRTTGMLQESVRAEGTTSTPNYTEIPFGVTGYGRFHEIGQFLTLIEQNPDRFMRVKNLTITNHPKRPSIHPVDLRIATFTFKVPTLSVPGEEPAPEAEAGAATGRAPRRR